MKKLLAALFISMILSSMAYADYTPQDLQNMELDGTMGASEC